MMMWHASKGFKGCQWPMKRTYVPKKLEKKNMMIKHLDKTSTVFVLPRPNGSSMRRLISVVKAILEPLTWAFIQLTMSNAHQVNLLDHDNFTAAWYKAKKYNRKFYLPHSEGMFLQVSVNTQGVLHLHPVTLPSTGPMSFCWVPQCLVP